MDSRFETISSNEFNSFFKEISTQNFGVIRFSAYRTAAKLRFIQKKTHFFLVDIWNAIEAIRENGLHVYQDVFSEVNVSKVESLVTSIYYQLNKRLPPSQHINIDEAINSFLTFLTVTYDPNNVGKIRVFAIKIAFATLCFGKLSDKLKYIYSLISDHANGHLIPNRFNAFLREVLALACSVFESGSYQYDESLSSSIFDFSHSVTMNMFVNLFFAPGGCPPCLSWFVILGKMAEVENVVHATQCEACHRQSFNGFRYKCQKCFNYNLCQDCFWRGRVSGTHNADTHPCKEYTYWKSPSKQFGRSIRKSFRCIPSSKGSQIEISEELPKSRRINLSHIVPPSPIPGVHQYHNGVTTGFTYADVDSSNLTRHNTFSKSSSLPRNVTIDSRLSPGVAGDEEHKLIARYAAKLANHKKVANDMLENELSPQSTLVDITQQQQVISQLESKNREIMREISRLRQEQENELLNKMDSIQMQDPLLMAELASLRQRKDELEGHLSALHESRRELMVQLDGIMALLKKHGNLMSVPPSATSSLNRHSTNSTGNIGNPYGTLSSTASTHSDISSVVSATSANSATSVNRDLLVAADSVTNAMSSLVKELNSEDEAVMDELELAKNLGNQLKLKEYCKNSAKLESEMDEEQKLPFKLTTNESKQVVVSTPLSTPTTTYLTTDDEESYIKTDDDELEDIDDDFWYNPSNNHVS